MRTMASRVYARQRSAEFAGSSAITKSLSHESARCAPRQRFPLADLSWENLGPLCAEIHGVRGEILKEQKSIILEGDVLAHKRGLNG